MKIETVPNVSVSAHQQGLVDLDEYADCEKLGEIVEQEARPIDRLGSITLDVRKCWLEYAHCSLFLDKTLSILCESGFVGAKKLEILTSIYFGSAELMASLFFQVSGVLGCTTSDSSSDVVNRMNDFCVKHNISIAVNVYSYERDEANNKINISYIFPNT